MGFVLKTFDAMALSRGGEVALLVSQPGPISQLAQRQGKPALQWRGAKGRNARVPAVFSAAQGLFTVLTGGRT